MINFKIHNVLILKKSMVKLQVHKQLKRGNKDSIHAQIRVGLDAYRESVASLTTSEDTAPLPL